jgi:NitT/TauT family transport system substrate-binding protein
MRPSRTRSYFWTVTLTLLLLASSVGCRKQADLTFRIGLGPWVGFGPLYLAQDKGFFRDAGLKVDLIVLTGLAERNSALQSNRIDALAAPVDSFVLAAGKNLGVRIVMAIDESNGGDGIVARKSVASFKDLRGKRVAFQRGLPSEFFLRALLDQNGMKLEDLNSVDMETAQAGAAFISNQLDAAGLWEPWLTRATEQGKGYVLASTKQYPDLIVDCLAVTSQVFERNPAEVQKIVNVILRAMEYWRQHPDESNAIMAPYFQLDPAKYANVLTGLKFCNLARNRSYFGASGQGPIFRVAERASKIWQQANAISNPVDPKSIVSTTFVEGAAE